MPPGILGHGLELVETARPLRGIALLEPLLVRHRLLLHVLDVERPATAFVGI